MTRRGAAKMQVCDAAVAQSENMTHATEKCEKNMQHITYSCY